MPTSCNFFNSLCSILVRQFSPLLEYNKDASLSQKKTLISKSLSTVLHCATQIPNESYQTTMNQL